MLAHNVIQVSAAPLEPQPQAPPMSNIRMVFMTVPDEETGARLVRDVVEAGLAACGNLLPGVRSIYRWRDEICDESEVLVLLKTTEDCYASLQERLVELHPYDCPEVIAVPLIDGHPDYLSWVREQTNS
jgi:periplasmic divalent cation tolerance protein